MDSLRRQAHMRLLFVILACLVSGLAADRSRPCIPRASELVARRPRAKPPLVAYNTTRGENHLRRFGLSTRVIASLLVRFRLTAFVSEVGESIRPVNGVRTWHVNLFYAVSWLYVTIDTVVRSIEESRVQTRRPQVLRVLLFMSVFHSIATMLIPAVAIHEAVHATKVLLGTLGATARFGRFATTCAPWMPTTIGLLLIPALPLVDEPLHHLLSHGLQLAWPSSAGAAAAHG